MIVALAAVLAELEARALAAGLSLRTIKELKSDLRAWARHCAELGNPASLPVAGSRLAAFLASQVDAGLTGETVKRRAWSLGRVHALWDLGNPASEPSCAAMLRGVPASSPRSKLPITRAIVARAVEALRAGDLSPRLAATIVVGAHLRLGGELAGLQWDGARREAWGWELISRSGECLGSLAGDSLACEALDRYAASDSWGVSRRSVFGARNTITRAVHEALAVLGVANPRAYSARSMAIAEQAREPHSSRALCTCAAPGITRFELGREGARGGAL